LLDIILPPRQSKLITQPAWSVTPPLVPRGQGRSRSHSPTSVVLVAHSRSWARSLAYRRPHLVRSLGAMARTTGLLALAPARHGLPLRTNPWFPCHCGPCREATAQLTTWSMLSLLPLPTTNLAIATGAVLASPAAGFPLLPFPWHAPCFARSYSIAGKTSS